MVQALLSLQTGATPPTQTPPLQASWVVHTLLSLQGRVLAAVAQPVTASQLSLVQGLLSLQTTGLPLPHTPPPQTSPVVHGLPSLQAAVLAVAVQPLTLSQASVVQAFLSSQTVAAPPTQAPALHASAVVHALPSEQGAVLAGATQPLPGSQASVVQGFLSSQKGGAPPLQTPLAHASWPVQALPSSQAPVSATAWQPFAASQLSVVQAFLSSHTSLAPPTHTLAAQASLAVQALPSVQGAVLATKVQPVCAAQLSVVQGFLSSQTTAAPEQEPPWHASPLVQGLPSSHGPTFAG